jgi:two-component system CheB/CheR fusion protein
MSAKKIEVEPRKKQKSPSKNDTGKTKRAMKFPPPAQKVEKSFPIVGIGASAGGLEAIEGLFSQIEPDINIAFVVIQHLPPTHKSIMDSLLKRYTKMKVLQMDDEMKIEPGCIYLNPPDKDVAVMNRTLYLIDPVEKRTARLPIDYFFRSLAADQGEKAICIILSGTGTDGTLGLKAIKGEGGMVMAQEESQAKYNNMPRNAIATGLVDYILPVQKMYKELRKYVKCFYVKKTEKIATSEQRFLNNLDKIFILIRSATGHDFSHYKQNTIRRRIERRMAVHQIGRIARYLLYLEQNPAEVEILAKEMLIGVTSFFRKPDAFEVLQEKVVPYLLENKQPDAPVRIWVPGCGSGEEAYSIAMIFLEVMERLKKHLNIQIFASDIDTDAVECARAAFYPESIAADVSPSRLKRFFIKEEDSYQIKKRIRNMVVFALHDLIKDPPFSKIDLVSCRNVLIYMDSLLQKKIFPLFHYSLNQDGFLFLGSSESIGEFTNLFSSVDTKWKIYKRKGAVLKKAVEYFALPPYAIATERQKVNEEMIQDKPSLRQLTEKLILEKHSSPSVLINKKYDILYFHGKTDKYISPPTGEARFNILEMAREELRYKLNTAIHNAVKQKKTVVYEGVRIKHNGHFSTTKITVRPLIEAKAMQGLMLVVFESQAPSDKIVKKKKKPPVSEESDPRIAYLEQQLQSTKEDLQTTIEELETSNEELKSTNEELQSTNEELQSSNEELGTSREELQSTNEELETVNAELEKKADELTQTNSDLQNLLSSTEIGTIFLDTNLRIKLFTPSAAEIFNLIKTDIGRPIKDITSKIIYEDFCKDAEDVLNTLNQREAEVQSKDYKWFFMRILPYRTVENVIDGVVITFVDIDKLKQTEANLRRLATVVTDSNDAITVRDMDGRITAWNKGAQNMYGYTEAEALMMNVAEIVPEDKRQQALDLIKQIKTGKPVKSLETKRVTKDGRILDVWLTATKLVDNKGDVIAVATTERDITNRK